MELITSLPKFDEVGTIMIVVEMFLKNATFMPAKNGYTTKETSQLFFKNVVKYWRLPRYIISETETTILSETFCESCSSP